MKLYMWLIVKVYAVSFAYWDFYKAFFIGSHTIWVKKKIRIISNSQEEYLTCWKTASQQLPLYWNTTLHEELSLQGCALIESCFCFYYPYFFPQSQREHLYKSCSVLWVNDTNGILQCSVYMVKGTQLTVGSGPWRYLLLTGKAGQKKKKKAPDSGEKTQSSGRLTLCAYPE